MMEMWVDSKSRSNEYLIKSCLMNKSTSTCYNILFDNDNKLGLNWAKLSSSWD